jgi:hypothetical protein
VIIRISLLLLVASLPIFLGVEVLLQLAVPMLPELITQLGAALLLSAFALLLLTAWWALMSCTMRSLIDYFSSQQRLQRRLLFLQIKQEQLQQFFQFRSAQVKYVNELERNRLLNANNRKHSLALVQSIKKELFLMEKSLPAATFQQLKQELDYFRSRQDIEALLKLQLKIRSLSEVNHDVGVKKLVL